MAYSNEIKIIDGWLMEAKGWDIWLGDSYFSTVRECILQNKPIESQMVGFIIGQASRHYERVLCEVCGKPILEEDSAEVNDLSWVKQLRCHKACCEKGEK